MDTPKKTLQEKLMEGGTEKPSEVTLPKEVKYFGARPAKVFEEKQREVERFRQGAPYAPPDVLQKRLDDMVAVFHQGLDHAAFTDFTQKGLNDVLMDLRSLRSDATRLAKRVDSLIEKFSPVSEFYNRDWVKRSDKPEALITDEGESDGEDN